MGSITYQQALELARKTIGQEATTLQALVDGLDDHFWECAQMLGSCPGLIWITGVGTSASVGERFAHLLTCVGARSMFLSPSEGLHGHTGILTQDDLLVALSRGGESEEVNQMISIANERGVKTIAFVHNTASTLAHLCNFILPIQSPQEYELMGYLATTSTVAFSAMCDALCAVVLVVKGYTPEQFATTHPGGAVGKDLSSSG